MKATASTRERLLYRCRCGKKALNGFVGNWPPPCDTCDRCGSVLASCEGGHLPPIPHHYEVHRVTQFSGGDEQELRVSSCSMCQHVRWSEPWSDDEAIREAMRA